MPESKELLGLYLHLARASGRRNRPAVRDKLLVLAGASAAERGLDMIAAFCRREVLANNPGHLVGHHPTLVAALEDERFQGFLAQLRRRYTRERAEHMVGSLGIDVARERETYFTFHEYAAALLGTTPAELDTLFGDLDELEEPDDEIYQATEAGQLTTGSEPNDSKGVRSVARRNPRGVWVVWGFLAFAFLAAAALGAIRWLARW